MSPDLFMELLYDFVHGVAPADGTQTLNVLTYRTHDHRFYVGRADIDQWGGGGFVVWVKLRSGYFDVQYNLPLVPALAMN